MISRALFTLHHERNDHINPFTANMTPIGALIYERMLHIEWDTFPVWQLQKRLHRVRIWLGRPHAPRSRTLAEWSFRLNG